MEMSTVALPMPSMTHLTPCTGRPLSRRPSQQRKACVMETLVTVTVDNDMVLIDRDRNASRDASRRG